MQDEVNSKYFQCEYDEQYCYPDSSVLKNKLNITEQNSLDEAERQITAVKLLALKMSPIPGNLDFQHLCAIHRFVFSDIYDWAGVSRSVNISKGNLFCNFKFIDNAINDLLAKTTELTETINGSGNSVTLPEFYQYQEQIAEMFAND